MANTYYKILNKKTAMQFNEEIIAGIRKELSLSTRSIDENIFDTIKNFEDADKLDMNFLLKCYAINKLMENASSTVRVKKESVSDYENTSNPNYKKSLKDNMYYRISEEGILNLDSKVGCIYKDGSYETVESMSNSRYKVKRLYDVTDAEISMQLIGSDGQPVQNKMHAVSLLNLRKEYVQRFKYSGFSGNSNDILAAIGNKFCSPIETGYFMDKYFHLYKWNENVKCFVRNTQIEMSSPLLTDYEFASGQKVVKKEYIGI